MQKQANETQLNKIFCMLIVQCKPTFLSTLYMCEYVINSITTSLDINKQGRSLNLAGLFHKVTHNNLTIQTVLLYLDSCYFHFLQQSNATPDEQAKFVYLMNTLAWFFFKLLVFGYVEDSETGLAFRLPGGLSWKIFVEVYIVVGDYILHLKINGYCCYTSQCNLLSFI